MTCQVFFVILAICVGFCFAGESIPRDSTINGTSEVLNATNQELVGHQDGTVDIFDASEKGSLAGVKYWYSQDPSSIRRKDEVNWTPLHWASNKGDLSIVQFLLSNGAEVDAVDSLLNSTPLIWASEAGHVPVVEALLDKGANINRQDIYKATPLHRAVMFYKLPVVKVLINRGANRSIKDDENKTPIDWARKEKYKEIEDYLSSH